MPHAKHHHKEITPSMHYTVVIALIISLITTFLLGMLLTETLWGSGLGYFNQIEKTAVMESRKARLMNDINRQVNEQLEIQEAQAKSPAVTGFDGDWLQCILDCYEWCETQDQEPSTAICRNWCGITCNDEHPKSLQRR